MTVNHELAVNKELIPNQVVLGERNYEDATALMLAQAKSELKIFDPDLSRGAYQSLRVHQLLNDFLARDQMNHLTIILHDGQFFTSHCPRLIELMKRYSHALTVYLTDEHAKVAQDAFVLVGHADYLHRFHIDHARFKYAQGDVAAARPLHDRFDQLLEATHSRLSPVAVGL